MRIGIDARAFFHKELKGIGVYLNGLISGIALLDKSNQYLLYYDSRKDIKHRALPGENFIPKGIHIDYGDTFFFWEQLALPWAIMSDKIDVFHASANILCLTRCPTIATIHDTILQEMPLKRFVERLYYRTLQPLLARRAEKVVTDSTFSRRCIIDKFGISENKISVIPLGVDPYFRQSVDENSVCEVTKKYQISPPYILSVGGESRWKNVNRLIEAYAFLVLEHKITESLVIVGIRDKGILETHLSAIAALYLTGKVKIMGYVPKMDLIALYNGAKVFTYPSLREGFGFPPLEAMACGVPVVASNAASIPEVVGDAAVLYNAKDVMDIANAIKRVLFDEGLRLSLCAKGLEKTKEYLWENTAEMTLNTYNSVFKKRYSCRR